MEFFLFFITTAASCAGAIAGFGGGIITKPILDGFGILPVSTVSFLSSSSVLAMSVTSLIRSRGNGVHLEVRTATPLAISSVFGGLAGNRLFELIRHAFPQERLLGFVQSVLLLLVMLFVLFYMSQKNRFPTRHSESTLLSLGLGVLLGSISAFLGIGGGPYIVSALFFFFSMDAKTAAKNSIYIIMFAQLASLSAAVVQHTVPTVTWIQVTVMMAGGVCGGLLGAKLSARMSNQMVERLLRVVIILICVIDSYNVIRFAAGS
ncbi:MAG: hypothetical protein H6Q60_1340 [Oscillospiraceae bacterium]|nr:hypothetical protein [Oscillospiraceae bacterium]